MSLLPARRACTTIQRRALRTAPKLARSASSHAHEHHDHDHHGHHHHEEPHPWTYPKETMTSRPIVVSSAVFVTLVGMNEAGFFNIEDGKHPITKFMSSKISSKETILEENLQAIEMVKEQAANYRLEKSARQDMFRPQKGIGPAANGSPHGLPVRPQVDISDIKPKRPPRE
ncbi:hypothetical protein FRC15_001236 [Serendipita sp. 397]|nr:hypothetical protein FRC15_001236 [Serendipita sp. 397]